VYCSLQPTWTGTSKSTSTSCRAARTRPSPPSRTSRPTSRPGPSCRGTCSPTPRLVIVGPYGHIIFSDLIPHLSVLSIDLLCLRSAPPRPPSTPTPLVSPSPTARIDTGPGGPARPRGDVPRGAQGGRAARGEHISRYSLTTSWLFLTSSITLSISSNSLNPISLTKLPTDDRTSEISGRCMTSASRSCARGPPPTRRSTLRS
jgi:hypothetical protein